MCFLTMCYHFPSHPWSVEVQVWVEFKKKTKSWCFRCLYYSHHNHRKFIWAIFLKGFVGPYPSVAGIYWRNTKTCIWASENTWMVTSHLQSCNMSSILTLEVTTRLPLFKEIKLIAWWKSNKQQEQSFYLKFKSICANV